MGELTARAWAVIEPLLPPVQGGGRLWFGYTRVFANPDETVKRKRVILREEVDPVEADALRGAGERILRGETVGGSGARRRRCGRGSRSRTS